MKVILSTFGPLHLIKSAEYLSAFVEIRVIQGWLPKWWNRWILAIASKIVGRDLFKSFNKRTPACLIGRNFSLSFAEFYLWTFKLLKLQSAIKYQDKSAQIYGWQSRHLLKDADIFHVRSGSGSGGAIERAREMGMKVLVDHSIAHPTFMDQQLRTEYDKYGIPFDLGLDNPLWSHIIDECNKGDVILVNSQFVKETFVENGFDENKIKVVLLGVRPDFFSIKQNYELRDGILRILFVGGFGVRKGAEYILHALEELDKEHFPYEFTCVGDSAEMLKILKKNIHLHLNRVNTIPQNELKKYLCSYDVFLFPSLCEGCASSGMEALAAGLPVIATRESGLPIENEKDGLIIPCKDTIAIINAITKIASDKTLRERIGKNAARKISENYTWEKYADNVIGIYNALVAK